MPELAAIPSLGARIRHLRNSAGLTQRRLAARAGISPKRLQLYEADKVRPRTPNLRRLCAALNVTMERLVGGLVEEGAEERTEELEEVASHDLGVWMEIPRPVALARPEFSPLLVWMRMYGVQEVAILDPAAPKVGVLLVHNHVPHGKLLRCNPALTARAAAAVSGNIREYRRRSGLTQEDLAALTGIDVKRIQRYEGGKCRPRAPNVLALCQALRVSPGQLVAAPSSRAGRGAWCELAREEVLARPELRPVLLWMAARGIVWLNAIDGGMDRIGLLTLDRARPPVSDEG